MILTPRKKRLIELAYQVAEALGIPLWCQDEAGPSQTMPQPGTSWVPEGHPPLQPHEYIRAGTAKLLTLFRPATGEGRAVGVRSTAMAPRLIRAGYHLTVYDRTREKAHVIKGASVVETPEEAASGSESKGCGDDRCHRFGKHAPSRTGQPGHLCGGERETYERCKPILDVLGKQSVYLGSTRTGPGNRCAADCCETGMHLFDIHLPSGHTTLVSTPACRRDLCALVLEEPLYPRMKPERNIR